MTGQCYQCRRRHGECSPLDQQKQQARPGRCKDFEDDPESPWNRGWL